MFCSNYRESDHLQAREILHNNNKINHVSSLLLWVNNEEVQGAASFISDPFTKTSNCQT